LEAWLVALCLVLCSVAASAESGSSKSLSVIADEFYWALQERSVRPNFSPRSNAAWVKKIERFERRLKHVKKAKLGGSARITYRMLKGELASQKEYVTKGWIQRDINGTDSPLHTVAEFASAEMYKNVTDWKWAIKTLKTGKTFLRSYIQNLEAGLEAGNIQNRQSIETSIASLKILTSKNAKLNPFLQLEPALAKSLKGKPQLAQLRKELHQAVNEIIPAHAELSSFLKTKYLPKASRLGKDRKVYLHHMERHLGPGHESPEVLGTWGRSEVDRLHRELEKTIRKIDPKAKNLASFMRRFNSRKSNQYKNAKDFIDSSKLEVKRSRELARKHMAIPRSSVDVKPVAKHQEATVAAQYYPNGPGKGVMELNTGKLLKDQRRSDLATLTTHEVFAGHHLAAMYAQKQADRLNLYRTESASTAYDEGWALYTEELRDKQKGFTPEERVGYLVNHLWRAARLVVDTGLHTGTMTPAQARNYFRRSTFVSPASAASEISRYIDWPGQALAYYVGKRQLVKIRAKVAKMLGKDFDAKKFHAKLLSTGAIPMHELDRAMVSWAKRRKSQIVSRKKSVRQMRSRAPAQRRASSAKRAKSAKNTGKASYRFGRTRHGRSNARVRAKR